MQFPIQEHFYDLSHFLLRCEWV